MPDESIPGPTPTGYQRTQGGGVAWVPPSAEHLSKLLPQYEVEALCGRGGMGAVYKGKQKTLDRAVAIKILPPDLDDEDASYTQRFKNEAKIMAKLDHPAIVPVYDFGETSEGQFYFVMSFIDGTDVAKMIQSQGRLPPEHALAIAAHVCDALKYAHANGVIHRDIKPANVLINMDGQVRVADFGLAKMDEPGTSGITKTGTAMGTPDFVAPETLTMGVDVDGRADLYAVGVMLYQMLTGNVPRGAWLPPSVQVPGVDRRFDPIVTKAMQFDREHRYQSAGEFRRALDVILTTPVVKEGGESSAAIPKQAASTAGTPVRDQKPGGAAAKPKTADKSVRSTPAAAPDPNHQSKIVNQKSKAPLLIGIAAVAAIAIGALVLHSSRREEASDATGHTSASSQTNGSTGTSSLVTSAATGASSAPIKVREEPKPAPVIVNSAPKPATPKPETLKPAPEKKEEPKPVASVPTPPPPATPTKESPQPARLPDPAKWVKVFDTPERASALGPSVKILDQGFEFTGTVILPTNEVTNSAIRMTIRRGTQCIIGFRNRSGKAVTAMVDRGVRIKKSAERADSLQLLSLLPSDVVENKVEVTLVENVMLISVDGKAMGSSVIEDDHTPGRISLNSITGAVVRDIAWQSLDVPLDEKLASAKALEQKQVAEAAASVPELATLDEQFKKLTAERVTAPFATDVAALNTSYLGGLDRKLAEEKKTGHLDSVLAIEAEKKLIQGAGAASPQPSTSGGQAGPAPCPIPSAEDDATSTTTPAVLKGLRQIYREAYAKIEAARTANMKALTDPLTTRLKLLESDLTKKDRIADAKTVKEYREGLAESSAGLQPAPSTSTRSGTTSPTAPGDGLKPLTTLKDGFTNSLGMKFVPVKGTDVLFCIHETRYKDYAAYAAEVPGVDVTWKNQTADGFTLTERADEHPVVNVSWEDSQKFCVWLSKKEGKTYRLPTDKEWSDAVGIGRDEKWKKDTTPATLFKNQTEYTWGDRWPPPKGSGNFSDQSRREKAPSSTDGYIDGYDDSFPTTAPVMSFKANKLGIYDLSGNAWEWCDDWFDTSNKERVLRGGGWNSNRGSLLSSYRDHSAPDLRRIRNGFRIVVETRSPSPATTKPGDATPPPPAAPPPASAKAPKSDFTNSLGMKFVKVPDTKVMFCIHETRRQDYAAYAAEVPGVGNIWKNQMRGNIPAGDKDDHPVIAVSWNEAQEFCQWLSKKEAKTYRLPTDQEWSFAVGIGKKEKFTANTTPALLSQKLEGEFPWGGGFPPGPREKAGNYGDKAWREKSIIAGYTDGYATTAPVMSFKPNKLGIYDLGGNVWEWCDDWFNAAQEERVLRGGSWLTYQRGDLLSSHRNHQTQDHHAGSEGVGFRIAVEMTAP